MAFLNDSEINNRRPKKEKKGHNLRGPREKSDGEAGESVSKSLC